MGVFFKDLVATPVDVPAGYEGSVGLIHAGPIFAYAVLKQRAFSVDRGVLEPLLEADDWQGIATRAVEAAVRFLLALDDGTVSLPRELVALVRAVPAVPGDRSHFLKETAVPVEDRNRELVVVRGPACHAPGKT
jgi:hypothetical protein